MLVLIDFSNRFHRIFHAAQKKNNLSEENIFETMMIQISNYKKIFGDDCQFLVIFDSDNSYWRSEIFSNYKASKKANYRIQNLNIIKEKQISENRPNKVEEIKKLDKKADTINITKKEISVYMNKVKQLFFTYSKIGCVDVQGLEADDVIAILANNSHSMIPIVIVSSDSDFLQLRSNNTKIYNPEVKNFVEINDNKTTNEFLKRKIITGDESDSIPNIISEDDAYINRNINKLTPKELNYFIKTDPIYYSEEHFRNYMRNKKLIDFSEIPDDKVENVLRYKIQIGDKNMTNYLKDYSNTHTLKYHQIKKLGEINN